MRDPKIRASRFLSLILRHAPERIGLHLDPAGWADLAELIACAGRHGSVLTEAMIREVVAESDKQRFALSDDGRRIRANQGHSIAADLGLDPKTPPNVLFHGTASRFLDSIRVSGLLPVRRRFVHLSLDEQLARAVGTRHGSPVVLVIRVAEAARAGSLFYLSQNEIWLTAHVPARFIEFPPRAEE